MEGSKDFIKEKGFLPKLSFQKTPKAVVKLLGDERKTIKDESGEDVEGIEIKVLHENEEKVVFTSSISLIQQLVNFEIGDTVKIEMKRKKTDQGIRTFFEVNRASDESEEEINEENF